MRKAYIFNTMAIRYYIPEEAYEDQIKDVYVPEHEKIPDHDEEDAYDYEVSHSFYHNFGRGHFTGDLFRSFKLNKETQIYERTKSFESICNTLKIKYKKLGG